jgi:hypothetical protein
VATCGNKINPLKYWVTDDDVPSLEENPNDENAPGPTFNDVPGQEKYWYWRDKPLRAGTKDEDETGFVPAGVLEIPLDMCYSRGMDCSNTCCKQTYCAETIHECISYRHRNFEELYICVFVVLSIVVGIPTCIKSMEFLLMFKFCRKFDEDENAFVGGVTVCECLTNLFGKNKEDHTHTDEIVVKVDELVDEEY